jgi:hypothetical protein
MQPIFVSKLFELLRYLEVPQQAVVEALGSTKTQVSLWAHGKRPVPKDFAYPLIQFVWKAMSEALAEARSQRYGSDDSPTMPPREADDAAWKAYYEALEVRGRHHVRQETGLPLASKLNEMLQAWGIEIKAVRGDLSREVQDSIARLAPYAKGDALKLTREERQMIHATGLDLARLMRWLEQLLDPPEEREWAAAPGPYTHPVNYLNDLAGWAGIRAEDDHTS